MGCVYSILIVYTTHFEGSAYIISCLLSSHCYLCHLFAFFPNVKVSRDHSFALGCRVVKVVDMNLAVQITEACHLYGQSSHLTLYHTKEGFHLNCIARGKVCELPAQGPGTPASSTSKTDRH